MLKDGVAKGSDKYVIQEARKNIIYMATQIYNHGTHINQILFVRQGFKSKEISTKNLKLDQEYN